MRNRRIEGSLHFPGTLPLFSPLQFADLSRRFPVREGRDRQSCRYHDRWQCVSFNSLASFAASPFANFAVKGSPDGNNTKSSPQSARRARKVRKKNQIDKLSAGTAAQPLSYALWVDAVWLPMCRLRRVERNVRRRIRGTPPKLCRRLPGLLQAERPSRRVRRVRR